MTLTWRDIKYFKPEDFDSPDVKGSGEVNMSLEFVAKLDLLRETIKRPIFITSGFRTLAHNKAIYFRSPSIPDSSHLRGLAADIRCLDSNMRYLIISEALKLGFTRLETAPRHIHLDIDKTLPQDVLLHLTDS